MNHIQICPKNQTMLHPRIMKTAIYTTYFVSEVEQLTDEFLMLDETHHFILIIIYTASSECEIFCNLQATKMARVGKI